MVDGICNRRRYRYRRQLAKAFGAQRTRFFIEATCEQDIEFRKIGTGWNEIAGVVTVDELARCGSVSDCSNSALDPGHREADSRPQRCDEELLAPGLLHRLDDALVFPCVDKGPMIGFCAGKHPESL
jgi:hypothetical protein